MLGSLQNHSMFEKKNAIWIALMANQISLNLSFLLILGVAFINPSQCSFLLVSDAATADSDVFLKSNCHLWKMLGLFASMKAF